MSTIKGIDIIRRWVIQTRLKEQTKQGGVMITLPKKEFVDLNTSITADRLLRSGIDIDQLTTCLLYTSPSPRDLSTSRMPSSA